MQNSPRPFLLATACAVVALAFAAVIIVFRRIFDGGVTALFTVQMLAILALLICASRLGHTKRHKGAFFVFGGLIIIIISLWLSHTFAQNASQLEKGLPSADLTRSLTTVSTYFSLLGSVFGSSSVARGLGYWADYDLESKK